MTGPLLKIAFRNLLKNRRRSAFTMAAIGLGYAAVVVFGGFTAYIFDSLEQSVIYGAGYGHVSVFRHGYNDPETRDVSRYLLSGSEHETIERAALSLDGVRIVNKQLDINGLASDGETSTVFVGSGIVPSAMKAIRAEARGFIGETNRRKYRGLDDDVPVNASLTHGLARKLDIDPGADVIISAPTLEGFINAVDLRVENLFESGTEFLEDKLILMHLDIAQQLYDTTSVTRVNILLDDAERADVVAKELETRLTDKGLDVEVFVWHELSAFYRRVRDMFNILFTFLFVIVFAIASMSVVNTVNMAVLERTREIGTLRALGANVRRIYRLFATESGLLAGFGVVLGLAIAFAVWAAIAIGEPTWVPPPFSTRIPLQVHVVPWQLLLAAAVFSAISVAAAIPPVARAVRRGIVSALGHS